MPTPQSQQSWFSNHSSSIRYEYFYKYVYTHQSLFVGFFSSDWSDKPVIQRFPSRTLNLRAKDESHQTLKYEVWSRSPDPPNYCRTAYSHFKATWSRTMRLIYECEFHCHHFRLSTATSKRFLLETKSRQTKCRLWRLCKMTKEAWKMHVDFLEGLLSVQNLSPQIGKLSWTTLNWYCTVI